MAMFFMHRGPLPQTLAKRRAEPSTLVAWQHTEFADMDRHNLPDGAHRAVKSGMLAGGYPDCVTVSTVRARTSAS
jgi:hypothetical protein